MLAFHAVKSAAVQRDSFPYYEIRVRPCESAAPAFAKTRSSAQRFLEDETAGMNDGSEVAQARRRVRTPFGTARPFVAAQLVSFGVRLGSLAAVAGFVPALISPALGCARVWASIALRG